MVLLAAAFSLRFFRFGGVQKMVLGGVATGFLIYVVSKLTDDLSKAELINPHHRSLDADGGRRPRPDLSRCCIWRTGDGAFRHHSSACVVLASVHRGLVASVRWRHSSPAAGAMLRTRKRHGC